MRIPGERLAITALFTIHGAVTGSLAARLPAISDHLHLSPGVLGFTLLMPAVGGLLTMPFAGRVVHQFGARTAARVLVALWGAALTLPALAGNLGSLIAALLVFGACAGVSDVAINAQGVAIEGRLGYSIMSSLHGLWSVGSVIGSGTGALMAAFGVAYPVHLTMVAIVLAVLAPLAGTALPSTGKTPAAAPDGPRPKRFSLPTGPVLLLGLVAFCAAFAEGSSINWSAIYLNRVTGANQAVAAAAYTTFACVMAVMRLSGDVVVDRLGPVVTVRAGGVSAVVGGVLIVLARGPVPAFAGFALLGVGIAVVVPLSFATAGRMGPHPGQAIAGVATVSYGASLIAPAVIGGVANAASLPAAFIIVAVLPLFIAVGAGLMRHSPPRLTQPTAAEESSDGHTT